MHVQEMRDHFKKIYPQCSTLEIENLISAIRFNKYWKVHPERTDTLFAVALSRAKIPFKGGFKAESTAPKNVIVFPPAARFCRRGRILIAKKKSEDFVSDTIVE